MCSQSRKTGFTHISADITKYLPALGGIAGRAALVDHAVEAGAQALQRRDAKAAPARAQPIPDVPCHQAANCVGQSTLRVSFT